MKDEYKTPRGRRWRTCATTRGNARGTEASSVQAVLAPAKQFQCPLKIIGKRRGEPYFPSGFGMNELPLGGAQKRTVPSITTLAANAR